MIAGAAMAFSSVSVVANSLRLRRFQALAGNDGAGRARTGRPAKATAAKRELAGRS